MLPVMLVYRPSFSLVIVALSLAALLTIVMSAKPIAGAPSGSEDHIVHATKSPSQNPTESRLDDMESSAKHSGGNADTNVDTGFLNNNGMMSDETASRHRSSPWSGGIYSSSNNRDSSVDKSEISKDKRRPTYWSEDIQVGCKELRARRYITDGFCTSEKPIKEVVCTGNCLPIRNMPWYAEFVKTVAKTKLKDWQCVEDVIKKKRVKLLCQNGDFRTYRIKVVKSCKCKKLKNNHNRTSRKRKGRRRRRKRRGKKEKKNTSSRGS